MLFRQLFDSTSSTYTYVIADDVGSEAIIIDPVIEQIDLYSKLLEEWDLKLVYAIDTHTHADHITATGELRNNTQCSIAMGDQVYDNVQQLISEVPGLGPHVRLLAVRSRFFRIRVRSSYADQTVRMESIVHRNPTNGEMLLISREFGVRFITQLDDDEEPS